MFEKSPSKRTLSLALGTAFAASLGAMPAANAAENPFGMTSIGAGYMVADAHADADKKALCEKTMKDGLCGEGKCGEGKCGAKLKAECETVLGTSAKGKEGKCGEGKCGGMKPAQ
jgi:uncharacterized low-complexity protein